MKEQFSDLEPELQRWKISAPLPRHFQTEVWRKIAAANRPTVWQAFSEWLDAKLLRPAPAMAYVTLLMMLGMGIGAWKGSVAASAHQQSLLVQYVQSVDPYQRP
jgi:hypothetical protein